MDRSEVQRFQSHVSKGGEESYEESQKENGRKTKIHSKSRRKQEETINSHNTGGNMIRSFIVTSKHDIDSGNNEIFSEVKTKIIHANNLVELFELINKCHGKDCIIYDEGTEREMLDQIYESNGDGDWYFIIGELNIDKGIPELTIILD